MREKEKKVITDIPQQSKEIQNEEKHSHRHHSHHHHSHVSSASGKHRKIKRFFRKNKKRLINIMIFSLLMGSLIFFAVRQDGLINTQEEMSNHIEMTDSTVRIESTLFVKEPSVVADGVSVYMDKDNNQDADVIYNSAKDQFPQGSAAIPVQYAYDVVGLPAGVQVNNGVLEVAEKGDFTKALQFQIIGQAGNVEIINLKSGTQYEYRLTLTLSNNTITGTLGEFTTKASPRFLQIDGLRNVRDIGGWKTLTGKTVKQGMLYRGTELDGAEESAFRLTPTGLSTMVDTLGIRYDMDLRSPTVNVNKIDVLGKSIPHKYYPIPYYEEVFHEANDETVRKIFSDLANKNNYPVYMHCTYGRDRTGTICYLLEGLLGISQEDAAKEYALTAFSGLSIDKNSFSKFQNAVDGLKGASFQEKVEGYLLSVGVTPAEINSIRNIFLENE